MKRLIPLPVLAAALITAGCGSTVDRAATSQPTVTQTTTVIEQAAPPPPSTPKPAFASCGGYVEALDGTTSCDFANNVFWEFFQAQPARDFHAYSPATGKDYEVHCTGGSLVTCTGGSGAEVRFPMRAVLAYTQSEADAYASSHDLGPDPSPQAGAAAQPAASAAPPADAASFCDTHACIGNFDNGTGYIVRCADGEWSHSGGRAGACSDHGGETAETYP